jgi:von Willebrand factor type A domain
VCIYSVMSFRLHGRSGEGKYYILMIDNSASMSATDVEPNRLEWAKREALKEIDAASDEDVGMVIVFNSKASTAQSRTNSKDLLRQVVRGIQPTQRPTDIREALMLAANLANLSRSTENEASRPAEEDPTKARTYAPVEGTPTAVHLFSDGRFRDLDQFDLGNLNVTFHAAGVPGPENVDNVGIVACTAFRDDIDNSKLQVFVRIRNYRPQPVKALKVELEYRVNGKLDLAPDRVLDLPAREVKQEKEPGQDTPTIIDTPGEGIVIFELKDLDETADVILHVRLLNVHDKFPLDDEAWLVVGVIRKARVLLVGKPNHILKAFFNAEEVASVTYLEPDKLSTDDYLKQALDGAYDLVVFDRCAPARAEDMPRANTFFIGYPPPPWKPVGGAGEGKSVEKLENPPVKDWKRKHPIMTGNGRVDLAALDTIGISAAFRIDVKDLPPHTPRLLETDSDAALLFTLPRQSFTDLVMTFAILNDKNEWNTNWPLMTSFPLFLRNVVYALGNVRDAASEDALRPGDEKSIRPDDPRVSQLQVWKAGRLLANLQRGSRSDFSFADTDQVGIYDIVWDNQVQRYFPINLLDADESNIEPRPEFKIGAEEVRAGKTRGMPLEMWRWFLVLGLVLLLLEWYIYNRRVYI